MSFFRNKNKGNGAITIELEKENTVIQPQEPTDEMKLFWIDTDE